VDFIVRSAGCEWYCTRTSSRLLRGAHCSVSARGSVTECAFRTVHAWR